MADLKGKKVVNPGVGSRADMNGTGLEKETAVDGKGKGKGKEKEKEIFPVILNPT